VVREKKHRLPRDLYNGHAVVSFTLCIKDRVELFRDSNIVKKFVEILLTEAANFDCEVPLYLFMPDHCHILLQGKSECTDILNVIDIFKQKSGFWLSKHHPEVHWQKDYYDHILRKEEDVKKHVSYILENPIRKSIVEDWKAYPFKGSNVHDLDSWI